ncbi:MFS transporter [Thioalkalivibrio paradoxus]|uniref:Membrane protein n=1 Tax=Thioalkalivibrio paradoxus ARh 1 TaxID=713585 RepID=W0DPR3_9GAMM|nr:MFS transporter [Thioalkalivibrio paradoxus]AHE99217.1 membrane protein [Thioalkalivibrio paradoxus ARh 1]
MTSLELRATSGLAAIYAVRMAGLFMVLPVFMLYADVLPAATPFLMGLALGIYGLTQAMLQIPFGMLSDRVGRKPLIALGLALFIAGSVIAALAESVYGIILGRALQGAGAVAAAVLALTADLIAEERRTRALAVIGLTIGVTFTASMVLGPLVDRWFGLAGIFWLTALLGLLALLLLFVWVPQPAHSRPHPDMVPMPGGLRSVLRDPELLRLNAGIFVLHLTLAANFLVLPLTLVNRLGLEPAQHYLVYLPVLLLGFALMIPAVIRAERQRALKPALVGAIVVLIAVQVLLPFSAHWVTLGLALVLFFAAFNLLEAALPSLVAKTAPVAAKGTAMGVFSSCQFLGIFAGGLLGGVLLSHGGSAAVFGLGLAGALLWLWAAVTMAPPSHLANRAYAFPDAWKQASAQLNARLAELAGVAEVRVSASEAAVYLKVDPGRFDETALRDLFRSGGSGGTGAASRA